MVRIAICDDLQEQLDIIKKAVQQYFHDKKEPTEVFTYNNAMDFVEAFEKEGNFDIVLLDICMPGLLGTDIAAEMRKQKSRAEIVFLSTSEEFAVEAFAVRAAHYLLDTLDAIAPGQFVSPGKGYIVNQSAIRVIKSDYIEIQGHKIPLAKRKYRQFQESYLKFIFGQEA